jgi:hypothetical protein
LEVIGSGVILSEYFFVYLSKNLPTMILLGLAIAPGLAICVYIFLKGIYDKVPKRFLLLSFRHSFHYTVLFYRISSNLA